MHGAEASLVFKFPHGPTDKGCRDTSAAWIHSDAPGLSGTITGGKTGTGIQRTRQLSPAGRVGSWARRRTAAGGGLPTEQDRRRAAGGGAHRQPGRPRGRGGNRRRETTPCHHPRAMGIVPRLYAGTQGNRVACGALALAYPHAPAPGAPRVALAGETSHGCTETSRRRQVPDRWAPARHPPRTPPRRARACDTATGPRSVPHG